MQWKSKVDIKQLTADLGDEKISFQEFRDGVVAEFRKNKYASELQDLLDELAEVETEDSYDEVMNDIYDFADVDKRIWIAVF